MTTSVVMCTYNGENYIEEQLVSILTQTIIPDEVIVSDDRSSDRTIEIIRNICEEYSYENIKISINETNLGYAENFIKALRRATGDYIFLCDQDDIWVSDKVELFLEQIKISRELLYFSNGYLVDSNRTKYKEKLWDRMPFKIQWLSKESVFDIMLKHSVVTGSAMAVSRDLIDIIREVEQIPVGWVHDDFLGMVAACRNSICPIDSLTYEYRQHADNIIGAKKLSIVERMLQIKNNFRNNENYHLDKLKKYSSFVPFCTGDYRNKIDKNVMFWTDICKADKMGRVEGIKLIITNAKNYYLFSTGIRAIVKDCFSVLFG